MAGLGQFAFGAVWFDKAGTARCDVFGLGEDRQVRSGEMGSG